MHGQLLDRCEPAIIALLAAFVLLALVVRLGPSRFDLRRLIRLHRCEQGAVQSLAFVLVLPIFMTIVLFIVQVSQLLIGMMVVNQAGFAAARSASVWIPARIDDGYETTNIVDPGYTLVPVSIDGQYVTTLLIDDLARANSPKLRRIRMAAVMGCAPASPSQDLGLVPATQEANEASFVVQNLYPTMVPSSAGNSRTLPRLRNKIAYSDRHTLVVLEWRDTGNNTVRGPSYNPRAHEDTAAVPRHNPNEVGWQDGITVYVVHRYALLSSVGRYFAGRLSGWRNLPLHVQNQLPPAWMLGTTGDAGQPIVPLVGTATITNEGLKAVRRHTLAP